MAHGAVLLPFQASNRCLVEFGNKNKTSGTMAWSKIGRKLFYIANCRPALERQAVAVTARHGDCGEAGRRSMRHGRDSCNRSRTMASAANEMAPEEAGGDRLHERGRRGTLFRGRRHSPFDLFDSFFPDRNMKFMIDRMDKLFYDPIFARSWAMPGGRWLGNTRPPWDFVETEEAFKMRLDLPGFGKEEVKVYVEDGSLVIEGEHSDEKKADESEWASRSQTSQYSTRIVLPDNANAEMIKAELKDGVLSVTVPKVPKEEPKKNVIDVEVE